MASHAQRIATFLKADPQVRGIVLENFLSGRPTLREPLPALWVEDVPAAAGQPATVRLHAYATVYQQAKALVRAAVASLEFFEDSQGPLEMETDDFRFHPKNGVQKLSATATRFELTQDLEIVSEPTEPTEPTLARAFPGQNAEGQPS